MRISDWSSDVCSSDLSVLIYVTPQKRFGDTGLVGGRALASFTTVKDIIAKAFGAYYSVSTQGKAHLLDLYRSLSQPADDDLVQVRTLGGFTILDRKSVV